MGMAPTNLVQFVCDNCGNTASFDRTIAGQYAPVGWYIVQVWNLPNHLTFHNFECMTTYIQTPPPVGSINSPGDNNNPPDEPPVVTP